MVEKDNNLSSRPNKSQQKREMLALQELGKILVELPSAHLAKIPLEPKLADAIAEARLIKSHEGKRRQLQYIGKLMRHIDAQPIQEALSKIIGTDQQAKALFHQIERLRDKLIEEGDSELTLLLQKYPQIEIQYLRQLVRRAKEERASGKKKGAELELFRYLRELLTE